MPATTFERSLATTVHRRRTPGLWQVTRGAKEPGTGRVEARWRGETDRPRPSRERWPNVTHPQMPAPPRSWRRRLAAAGRRPSRRPSRNRPRTQGWVGGDDSAARPANRRAGAGPVPIRLGGVDPGVDVDGVEAGPDIGLPEQASAVEALARATLADRLVGDEREAPTGRHDRPHPALVAGAQRRASPAPSIAQLAPACPASSTVRASGLTSPVPGVPTPRGPRSAPRPFPRARLEPLPQAAQHDRRDTSRVKVWAVSLSASAIVRYGAQVSASWVTVILALIA